MYTGALSNVLESNSLRYRARPRQICGERRAAKQYEQGRTHSPSLLALHLTNSLAELQRQMAPLLQFMLQTGDAIFVVQANS
jgi:hypothetical protein